MSLKLIHCADVHLDAPMETNLSAAQAEQRRGELLETFLELIAYARQAGVRAVLIAGDLFDGARVSATTQDVVFSAMENAPDVDFLLLPGNHDSVTLARLAGSLPPNVVLFGSQWESVRYGDVVVSGCEMLQSNCTSLYAGLNLDPELTNIVMLHGQLGTRAGMDLVDASQLRGRGIDYLALGHIHAYGQQKLDARGVACYSGCLEGRGFDECGPKGFVELTCENGMVNAEFVPFARRQLHTVTVGITNVENVTTMLDLALKVAASQEIPSDSLVKFELQGGYSPDANKDLAYLESSLNREFFFAKVVDKTRLLVDANDFAYDQSLRGAFVRAVMASGESEEEKQRIIQCGLRALRGEEVAL